MVDIISLNLYIILLTKNKDLIDKIKIILVKDGITSDGLGYCKELVEKINQIRNLTKEKSRDSFCKKLWSS